MDPVQTPKQRQAEHEEEHEQEHVDMKGYTNPRCWKCGARRTP